MPKINPWTETVDIKKPMNDKEKTFEQKRDGVVTVIRSSRWFKRKNEFSNLHQLVDEIASAQDPEEFDCALDCIYDEADADRIWLGL